MYLCVIELSEFQYLRELSFRFLSVEKLPTFHMWRSLKFSVVSRIV